MRTSPLFVFLSGILFAQLGFAATGTSITRDSLTLSGRLLKPNGTALTSSSVTFELSVASASGTCVFYKENISNVDLSGSDGNFEIHLGSGSKTFPTSPGIELRAAFKNLATLNCSPSGSYQPTVNEARVLYVQFIDNTESSPAWRQFADSVPISSAPFAMYAESSTKLGDNVAEDFLTKVGLPICTTGQYLTWNGTAMTCGTAGGGGGGTVTSVNMTLPTAVFDVTGGPITASGSLDATFKSQAASTFFAAPTSAAGAPSFRVLDVTDLPSVGTPGTYGSTSNIPVLTIDAKGRVTSVATVVPVINLASGTTGTLQVGSGGTGGNTAAAARTNLSAAISGNNNDITSLTNATNISTSTGSLDLTGMTGINLSSTAGDIFITPTGNLQLMPTAGGVYSNAPIFGNGGSPTSPAFTSSNATGTGIFFPSTGRMGFSTDGIERMRIDPAGRVVIGGTNPMATLDVRGTIIGTATDTGSATSFDFSLGNIQYTNSSCDAFSLTNIRSGGSYTLVVKGGGATTCSFSAPGFTVHLPADHGPSISGKHTIYNFFAAGGDVYFSWNPGY